MTAWRHRSTFARLSWIGVIGLILAYGVLLVSVKVHEQIIRSHSEALYDEFLAMRSGVTTKADVDQIRKQWANKLPENVDCSGDACDYSIGDVWGWSRWFLVSRFAHDHAPSSMLQIETKGNYVLRSTFSVRVMVPAGYGTREERKIRIPGYVPYSSGDYALIGRASLAAVLPRTCCEGPFPEKGYRTQRVNCMNCLEVRIGALPSVAAERRKQLFQVRFDCMTQWTVCTDKEDLMPIATQEEARENAVADDVKEMERKCTYTPEELAGAAGNAVELQVLGEMASNFELNVRILRYIGGTHPLHTGQDVKVEMSRSNNRIEALQQARASGGRMLVLYTGSPSYGLIQPYDQCGLLPDNALEAVAQHF